MPVGRSHIHAEINCNRIIVILAFWHTQLLKFVYINSQFINGIYIVKYFGVIKFQCKIDLDKVALMIKFEFVDVIATMTNNVSNHILEKRPS